MEIRCPYCQHRIALNGAKPGHYTPACPSCHHKFDLLIPRVEGEPPRVSTRSQIVGATVPPPAAQATVPPAAPAKPGQPEVRASQTTAAPHATSAPQAATAPPRHAPAAGQPSVHAHPAAHPPSDATVPPAVTHAAGAAAHGTFAPRGEPAARVDRSDYHTDAEVDDGMIYDDLTGDVAGYDILKKLGQGGMGSVYLARQISLDRHVALKTLSPSLAMDASFVARFTREAYAAAQLNHHNVVQIHDIGQDRGTNFYSMELVEGQNLADVVEREGRLDPVTAVGYVLQAARGLKFAHQHGLIHRDVKPENLLLNGEGIVKVADLGLVKRAGQADAANTMAASANARQMNAAHPNATQLNTSMGTPAYMAPEQARDAAKVDQRADIYSLGCTLYDLLTGRPPFAGKTALEVMTKHQKEPITPPEKIVADLPVRLSQIVQRMTAKDPAGRYQHMDDVVHDLEDFLGVEHGGGVRASQDAIKTITTSVERFNASPFAGYRGKLVLAFYAVCGLAVVAGVLTFSPALAVGAILFAIVATLAYQLTLGLRQRTAVYLKVRQWLLGASIGDWLTSLAAVALGVLLLAVLQQLGTAVAVALVAATAAVLFHFFVDGVVQTEREEPLRAVEALLRDMRAKGLDEEGIRGFIAKFSGNRWEAFYEALFGYDAKIDARRLYGKGERGRDRKRYGVWRDWLLAWIDRRIEQRKQERERKLLEKLEQKALEARGTQTNVAARQAKQTAGAIVENAYALKEREAATLVPTEHGDRRGTTAVFVRPSWLDEEKPHVSEQLEGYKRTGYLRRRYGGPIDVLLGRRVRFLLAAAILLGAAKWVQQNGVVAMAEQARVLAASNVDRAKTAAQKRITTAVEITRVDGVTAHAAAPTSRPATTSPAADEDAPVPLRLRGVPDWICDAVGSWNGVAAGLLLLLSVPIYGHAMTVAVLLCAALALFGSSIPIPTVGHLPGWLTGVLAVVIALPAMFFLRRTED